MARAPAEQPSGLVVRDAVITPDLERDLVERFERLSWEAIFMRGQTARRTARHFGFGYDYEARSPRPGEPIPDWLEPPRRAAAALGGVAADDLVEILLHLSHAQACRPD